MRLAHISDLHIGKRVNGYSLIEDQEYILNQIIGIIEEQSVDAILISGDVYDRSDPSAEAVRLFDSFLYLLKQTGKAVFISSGNHDSATRLSFGSGLFDKLNIHISPIYDGRVKATSIDDVDIYMLPYINPTIVRSIFPDEKIDNYTDALSVAIKHLDIDHSRINVLLSHQFVLGAITSDSEEMYIGGLENVDISIYKDFDYVALGHLHRPQNVSSSVRYSGSPLKYSFSEVNDKKSVSIINIESKGSINIETCPLKPLREMKEIKGKFEDIIKDSSQDYMHIVLTDSDDIPNAQQRLRSRYPYLMLMEMEKNIKDKDIAFDDLVEYERKSPLDLFSEFYQRQNGNSLNDEDIDFLRDMLERMGGDDETC